MGLLFLILIVRGALPSLNLLYGSYDVDDGLSSGRILCQAKSRILSVRGCGNGLNSSNDITLCSRQKGFGGGIDSVTGRRCENVKVGPGMNPKGLSSWPSPGSEAVFTQNSSESLPALLYVPRNGKHVKIDGNLIIHSVLAGEKAIQQTESRQSLDKETGLAIAGNVMSALAISKSGKGLDLQHSKSYGVASDSDDTYANNLKLTSSDGPQQQWFREGMAGPILSSGMCTEVFQFDVSSSSSSSSIFPTGSIMNSSSSINATENLLLVLLTREE
ncbi:BZIP transcription factor [Musa troglodytarum]|uniref:BZIP transcription factor n=1 Tax=Musa troglodytarum TaxID=320322 RepID=A0A9E7E8U4_9LILI|nr:BZIP transcription factor [Musa troglodytarum]